MNDTYAPMSLKNNCNIVYNYLKVTRKTSKLIIDIAITVKLQLVFVLLIVETYVGNCDV